jgi:hypothetical protein
MNKKELTRTHSCMSEFIVANFYSFVQVFSVLCICFSFINNEILFSTFLLPAFTFFFLLYLRLNLCNVTMAVYFIHLEIC